MDINDRNDQDKAADSASAISSDLIRGHINTIILRTLYDGDKYGYEIISEIESKSKGQYVLKQPTLYSALKRLESQDYVTSYWGGVSNGGRRKYFQITDKGKRVVEQNLAEWEYSRTVIDSLISERDYDFNNPPPASSVDFSLLKKSTSRVPVMHGDGNDPIELDYDEEAYAEAPAPDAEEAAEEAAQPAEEPVIEAAEAPAMPAQAPVFAAEPASAAEEAPQPAQEAPAPAAPVQEAPVQEAPQPAFAGWTREDPLEAVRPAAEPVQEEAVQEVPVQNEPAPAVEEKSAAAEAMQPQATAADPTPIIVQDPASNMRWTRESPLEKAKDEDDPAEKEQRAQGSADETEDEESPAVEDIRPLTTEERRRIHENYQSLIGSDDDATSYYYSQVAKDRSVRPSYESRSDAPSARTQGYTMDQYQAQSDLYEEQAMENYGNGPAAPQSYDEAYRQNKAISSELLYSDKTPEERNYKELLSQLYDNSRHEYDDYGGYGSYGTDPYMPAGYDQGFDPYQQPYPDEQAMEEAAEEHAEPAPADDKKKEKNSASSEENKQKQIEAQQQAKAAAKKHAEEEKAAKAAALEKKRQDAIERKAQREGLRIAAARERAKAAEEMPGKSFDKGKALFWTALWVFGVALIESVVNICLRGVLGSNLWYVIVPFIIDFLFMGVFLFLYLSGYGKNSRKSLSRSYISASFVVFVNILLIICLIAFLVITFANDTTALTSQIVLYVVLPVIYACNIPLFALLYSYFSNKQ